MELTPYIISQIIGFIALTIGLIALQLKSQKAMLPTGELSNAVWIAHYLLLGGYTAAFTMFIAIIRTTIVLLKPKWKIPALLIATALIFTGCTLSTEAYWYKYLPFIAALTYSSALYWNDKFLRSRILTLLTMSIWLLYGFMIQSLAELTESTLCIISISIGIIRHHKHYQPHKPSA